MKAFWREGSRYLPPGTVGMKAFWREGSRYLLESINCNQQFRRREVKSLPMHGLRAISRKFPGSEGFWLAEPLLISRIAATFHSCHCGIMDCDQHRLNKWTRMGIKDEHFLNTTYPTLSKGDGAERDLILLRTQVTLTAVIGLQFISTSGGGGVGIQDGWTKFRWPVPFTSEKKL